MEQKIDATTWDAHLLKILAENLDDDDYTRPPLENSILQYLEHILAIVQQELTREEIKDKGFFSLSENDAVYWLFLTHTIQNASIRETLERLTIPYPSLYLTSVIKQADRSFFERLLAAEVNAEMFYETRPFNKKLFQLLVSKSFEFLQANESITDRNVTLLHFSKRIPNSVLVSKVTQLMERGANGRGQADGEALSRFTGLKTLWIDLFDYSTTPLPNTLFDLPCLRNLHLDKNKLTALPPDIAHLQTLSRLNLRENQLTRLPDEIGELKALDSLDLERNQLTELPATFLNLENLTNIKLDYNAFTEIPTLLFQHEKLLVVNLTNNKITHIPAHIEETNTSYYLAGNLIDELPEEFKEERFIYNVKVLGNPLRNLSPEFVPFIKSQVENTGKYLYKEELTGLFCWMNFHENKNVRKIARDKLEEVLEPKMFDRIKIDWRYRKNPDSEKVLMFCLKYHHPLKLHWPLLQTWLEGLMQKSIASIYSFTEPLYELPEGLFNLKALQNLDVLTLYDAQLKTIPEDIVQLPRLSDLSLGNNVGLEIPDFLPQLKLKKLALVDNGLQAIPEVIGQMHTLKQLFLKGNQITLGFELLTQLPKLEELYLQENSLTQMPEILLDVPNLKVLSLDSNQLGVAKDKQEYAIPLRIGFMDNLVKLDLTNNHLKKLPPGIGLLEQLEEILLAYNQFDEFPIELCEVETLRSIFFSNNNISRLPEDMKYLTQLEFIDLRGNPLPKQELQKLVQLLPNIRIRF
ncbi:hypothetical protein BKI52_06160 [marine bacterium AO1-C]|nr:hypothetical protein BKI52_06160 [marine bacterium AO1-C]